ncbi:MAG: hydroxymethylbilane synthase [Bdellovibrionales bacterium]|nr:hydroxymethylbilane synthase [Bdellovibrionales bacterium]
MPDLYLSGKKTLIIASRKSDLARLQAQSVAEKLKQIYPEIKIQFHYRESLGDINLNDPLWKMPEKGVFTEDFYQDLVKHKVDMVVHSWKDLPIEVKSETRIAATLARADARDVLLFKKTSVGKNNLKLFTSSPRRIYNLDPFFKWSLPWNVEQLEFNTVRGNVQTRIRKLLESVETDGLIVAKAALDRLIQSSSEEFRETREFIKTSLSSLKVQVIPLSQNPTAAAQGALAIEIAKDRHEINKILEKINSKKTYHNVSLERKILAQYGGGCHQKIGISIFNKNKYQILFLKGLTDQGRVLDAQKIDTDLNDDQPSGNQFPRTEAQALHKMAEKEILPKEFSLNQQTQQKPRFFFITKEECLPNIEKDDVIWTSGIKTWRKLAQKGHWVCGSFDSLGEDASPGIDHFFDIQGKAPWIKITHEKGHESSWAKKCATYQVQYKNLESLYDPKVNYYYWSHGELFKSFYEKFPEIKDKYHSGGVGSTLNVLSQYIDSKKIIPCLNYEDWLKSLTKE